jgi:hypothetical protein
VDAEAALDEEELVAHGLEPLSETWMLMEFCDRCALLDSAQPPSLGRKPTLVKMCMASHGHHKCNVMYPIGQTLSCFHPDNPTVGHLASGLCRGSLERSVRSGLLRNKADGSINMVRPAASGIATYTCSSRGCNLARNVLHKHSLAR